MIKEFNTVAVLGVFTGRVLAEHGFSEIHEIMDHFYPGIMTLGCASMAKTASHEVARQHPEFNSLPECTKENWEEFTTNAVAKFGDKMNLNGPHGTGNPDMMEP